jgi:hypothetical protein
MHPASILSPHVRYIVIRILCFEVPRQHAQQSLIPFIESLKLGQSDIEFFTLQPLLGLPVEEVVLLSTNLAPMLNAILSVMTWHV